MAATEVTTSAKDVRTAQIASLTGMRGFAALVVVLVHTSGYSDYPWVGVHGYGPIALFTLSGFLLYRPFARWIMGVAARPSIVDFGVRRVFRIFPPYLVVLFIWVLVYPRATPSGAGDWLRAVTLTNTFDFFGLIPGLRQAWSLGTELSWYVALPFVTALVMFLVRGLPEPWKLRVHVWLLLSTVPISVAWSWYCHNGGPESGPMWLPAYFGCFGLGALVGLMMEAERSGLTDISRGRRLMGNPWLLPAVAVFFVAISVSDLAGPITWGSEVTLVDTLVRNGSSLGLALTLLVLSVFGGPRSVVVRMLSSRVMQATGRWSYGIYLWHLPVLVLLIEEFTFARGPESLVLWLAVICVLSYLLGAATYAWVEVPTMAWSKQISAKVTGKSPLPTPATASSGESPVAAADRTDR